MNERAQAVPRISCVMPAFNEAATLPRVVPQVLGRFVGFATYQLDSNLRNSTMVGIVGAGGIGGTLFSAFQRFDYDFVLAILISIIAIIMVGEVLARLVRSVYIDGRGFGR